VLPYAVQPSSAVVARDRQRLREQVVHAPHNALGGAGVVVLDKEIGRWDPDLRSRNDIHEGVRLPMRR
jgi:hypothetical protein